MTINKVACLSPPSAVFFSQISGLKIESYSMKLAPTISLAALIASLSSPALAQTTEPFKLADMIVTATHLYSDQVNALRSPTPIIDVPQSLSIISEEQIILQGFTSIGDIVNYTPGVHTSQGEGHRDAVVFRGVRSTADFFIDGVRDDVQYYRPLYNLEQVEILRGPNALLFGRGGTGGILNRVTKKSVIGEQFTGYKASADTFGEFDVQIDTNFITSETSALRVNAFYESLNNHRDFYDGDRFGINPNFMIELTPDTTLDLSYEYANFERFVDRGIPTGANGRPVEAFDEIFFGDEDLNTAELEAHILRATVQHNFSDNLKANVTASYGDYDKLYQNLFASDFDQANAPDRVELDGYVDTTQRESFTLSGNLIGEFETSNIKHTIVTGGEYITTENDNDRFNTNFSTTNDDMEFFSIERPLDIFGGVGVNADGIATVIDFTSNLNDRDEADVDVFSAYIQDEIELSDKLSLVLGLRYDDFDIDVVDLDDGSGTAQNSDSNVSPRLGLIYKPQENISLYGSYSESFLPRSGEQFANINGDNAVLDANTYENIEAGVKWDIHPALSLTAAIFQIEESAPQVADTDSGELDIIDTETNGVEIQLSGQITDDWFVTTGYTWLDGDQIDEFGNEDGRPRELPRNAFSIWNNFQATDKLGLGLGLTYQDESFVNNGNTAILPSYTRIDAAAFYDVSDDLRVQVNIENLTDETYFPNSHATHQVTVGAPINARFTVSGKF